MIRVSRHENKELVAQFIIFHDTDSAAACVGKKKTGKVNQKILYTSWKPLSQIVPSKAEYFDAIHLVEKEVQCSI